MRDLTPVEMKRVDTYMARAEELYLRIKEARPVRDYIITNAAGVEIQVQLDEDDLDRYPGAKPVQAKQAAKPADKQAAPRRNKAKN